MLNKSNSVIPSQLNEKISKLIEKASKTNGCKYTVSDMVYAKILPLINKSVYEDIRIVDF